MGVSVFTTAELAEMLKTSRSQVCKMISGGELPAVRVGREYRVTEDALSEFLKAKGERDDNMGDRTGNRLTK